MKENLKPEHVQTFIEQRENHLFQKEIKKQIESIDPVLVSQRIANQIHYYLYIEK